MLTDKQQNERTQAARRRFAREVRDLEAQTRALMARVAAVPLLGYKRVRVGRAYQVAALAALRVVLAELHQLHGGRLP